MHGDGVFLILNFLNMADIKDLEKFAHRLAFRETAQRLLDGADKITDPRRSDYDASIAASIERDAPHQAVSSAESLKLASNARVTER